MASKPDVPGTIIAAALNLAQTQGWRRLTLADIARESGVKLERIAAEFPSKDAILAGFARRIDAQILKEPLDESGTVRERLFELLMRRFDALAPHRGALRAIVRDTLGDPLASLEGLYALARSMALTLEAAGVSASGPLGPVRVKVLGAVYLGALVPWLRGNGDTDRLMARIDRALARVERLAQSVERTTRPRRDEAPSDVEIDAANVADTSEQST